MESRRIATALLVLRVTVFVVMLVWTIDKFVRPAHAASVYQHFYFLRDFGPTIIYSIGATELLLLIGFVIGFARRLTYGLVPLLHAVSTFSSFRQYLHPFEGPNILFFAAWPMLGACFALYYLRDLDTIWSVSGRNSQSTSSRSSCSRGGIGRAVRASHGDGVDWVAASVSWPERDCDHDRISN